MNYSTDIDWWLVVQILFDICAITFVYYIVRTNIPMIPTQKAARDAMIQEIAKEIESKPGQNLKIYDMGSGLGGLCFALAKAFPSASVVGLEMAWPAWALTTLRQKIMGPRNLRFVMADFWSHDISDGDITLFYLGDVVMQKIGEKLKRDARPGRLILSNTFPIQPFADWPPQKRIAIPAQVSKELLVYRQS